jgi:hypothetical protein
MAQYTSDARDGMDHEQEWALASSLFSSTKNDAPLDLKLRNPSLESDSSSTLGLPYSYLYLAEIRFG